MVEIFGFEAVGGFLVRKDDEWGLTYVCMSEKACRGFRCRVGYFAGGGNVGMLLDIAPLDTSKRKRNNVFFTTLLMYRGEFS